MVVGAFVIQQDQMKQGSPELSVEFRLLVWVGCHESGENRKQSTVEE